MRDPVYGAVRAVARRNSYALVWAQFGLAHLVVLGGIGLLALYQPMSDGTFWLLVAVSQGLVSLDNLVSIKLTRRMWRPVRAWEQGARDEASTTAAWMALATLPFQYTRRMRKYPFLFSYLPFIAFVTWELRLHWYLFFVLAVAGTVVLAYALIVRYFTMEIVVRPVLERLAEDLPPGFAIEAPGLPLAWRLLAVAPVINVITGVVVAGLVSAGHQGRVANLGLAWLIAVGVSFTISLELVILVVRNLVTSLGDLRAATERIRSGDFSARVPVVATDEMGELAQSFNTMVQGLAERERLRDAFGAYVDHAVADRVAVEGASLEGEEVEVSVLFLDICDFTAFAERSAPREVVAALTGFWELVVPVLSRHGGHANKFIGDGLLAVFGAPERRVDHADRAVAAALEVSDAVRSRWGGAVRTGIGVNSGPVIAGSVGGGGRVEYTVIGDVVNTAARVERATRQTDDEVLITDATRRLLTPGRFELAECATVALRGKRERVTLWCPARAGVLASARGDGDGHPVARRPARS